MKAFDESIYKELNAGSLEPILNTFKILKENGVWFEITNLIVPNWTDDMNMIEKMVKWLVKNGFSDYPIHFSRFSPAFKLTYLPSTPVSVLDEAHKIATNAGMKYVYIGNVPNHQANNTYCHNCGKIIIERKGYSVIKNHIVDGVCEFCNVRIPGVWK